MTTKLIRIARYPFTSGAVALALATLVGTLPYAGAFGAIVAGAFAIPIVRTSSRGGDDADAMPRLLPPPPELPPQLAMGAVLHLVYFGPYLLAIALVFVAQDEPAFEWLRSFTVLLVFVQLFFLIAWPAAAAVLAIEGNPLPAFSRGRLIRMAGEMAEGFAIALTMVLLGGVGVFTLAEWLTGRGLVSEALASLLVAWFWIVSLHLVGRGLRKE
jgi:hypothetical protein